MARRDGGWSTPRGKKSETAPSTKKGGKKPPHPQGNPTTNAFPASLWIRSAGGLSDHS